MIKKNLWWFVLSIFVIALDLLTKNIFIDANYSVIGDFVWFVSTINTGASFGMLEGWGGIFIALGVVVSAVVFWIVVADKFYSSKFFKFVLVVLLGGIWGNLIDRVVFGYVRDFIYLKFINFAIFNVADMAICISTALLVIFVLFCSPKQEVAKQEPARRQIVGDSKVVDLNSKKNNTGNKNDENKAEVEK